jgi:ParB/RepB/Spo0J family partition protein
MNAPDAVQLHAGASIPLDRIAPSKTNPRKTFTQAALDELTDSVRQHGILQPVLVRPMPGDRYELVAGERRYRAAIAAGLAEIPALVRELGDAEALELQVIENLQREDLHELEEAEGYEQLMRLHAYTADDLAAKVGKSKAYVYARLKLCALVPVARKMFYDRKFSASTALLIARIPVADLQAKAAKEVVAGRYTSSGEPMSYRDAAEHLQRHYMLRLADAVFDPADTLLIAKVGACGPCPKRTGNQPELFGDVKAADVCTDPVCFGAKREAHFKWVRAEAEAAGKKIISGKAAKAIFPYGHSTGAQGGYKALDDKNYNDPKSRTYRQLAKLAGVDVVLVEQPDTKDLVEVVPETAMKSALKKAGLLKDDSPAKKRASDADRRERDKQKAETTLRERIFESLRGRLTLDPEVTTQDGVLVALALWDRADFAAKKKLVDLYGWNEQAQETPKKGLRTANDWDLVHAAEGRIASLPSAPELWRLMIELSVIEAVAMHPRGGEPDDLIVTAKRHGVDVEALRKEAMADLKAKEKPKAKTKAKKIAADKPAKTSRAPVKTAAAPTEQAS